VAPTTNPVRSNTPAAGIVVSNSSHSASPGVAELLNPSQIVTAVVLRFKIFTEHTAYVVALVYSVVFVVAVKFAGVPNLPAAIMFSPLS